MLLEMKGAPEQFLFPRQPCKPKSPVRYRAAELCCDLMGTLLQSEIRRRAGVLWEGSGWGEAGGAKEIRST